MKMLYIVFILAFFSSCSVSPEPIHYNEDECAYCKMKISDSRFGAELVTKKGKIFKYDSGECLVRTYIEGSEEKYAHVLVTDYSNPHSLIDAKISSFLISENQKSPMGGNLSAYKNKGVAEKVLLKKGGELFGFNELVLKYKSIYQ